MVIFFQSACYYWVTDLWPPLAPILLHSLTFSDSHSPVLFSCVFSSFQISSFLSFSEDLYSRCAHLFTSSSYRDRVYLWELLKPDKFCSLWTFQAAFPFFDKTFLKRAVYSGCPKNKWSHLLAGSLGNLLSHRPTSPGWSLLLLCFHFLHLTLAQCPTGCSFF